MNVGRNQEMVFDRLVFVVDHNDADVGKLCAGRLDPLAVLAFGHLSMAVRIQSEIDARDFVQQIDGTIAVRLGVIFNAQVEQAEDQVTFLTDAVNSGLCQLLHVFMNGKGEVGDQTGVDLCACFGGFHADKAEFQPVLCFGDVGRGQDRHVVRIVQGDVRADGGKAGLLQVIHQLVIAEVKLMVAEGDHVIGSGVHHFDGRQALAGADIDVALAEVAGVNQQHIGPAINKQIAQPGDVGIAQQLAVDIIGVQDDGFAFIAVRQLRPVVGADPVVLSAPVLLRRLFGQSEGHGQRHDQCQKQR